MTSSTRPQLPADVSQSATREEADEAIRNLKKADFAKLLMIARHFVRNRCLRRIELDPQFDPNPRTIFQIERHFNLPEKSLVVLSGAVHVDNDLRDEAVRFAASSERVSELTKEERKLLNQFVKFLREHSDR